MPVAATPRYLKKDSSKENKPTAQQPTCSSLSACLLSGAVKLLVCLLNRKTASPKGIFMQPSSVIHVVSHSCNGSGAGVCSAAPVFALSRYCGEPGSLAEIVGDPISISVDVYGEGRSFTLISIGATCSITLFDARNPRRSHRRAQMRCCRTHLGSVVSQAKALKM